MATRRKLNDVKIDAIEIKGADKRKPRGAEFFPSTYPNIALIAKKKSGKTNLLYHILKKCIDKHTDVHIFCSTAKRDDTWKDMIEYLENQGNKVHVKLGLFEASMDGKRKRKVNQLEKLIDSLASEDNNKKGKKQNGKGNKEKKGGVNMFDRKERAKSIFDRSTTIADLPEHHLVHSLFGGGSYGSIKGSKDNTPIAPTVQPKKDKRGRGGPLTPDRVFIFDDLSNELNDPQVARLLKANRHFKSMCIVSTQYVNDIPPTARSQFDYVIAFKGHTARKVETIRKMTDSNVDENQFLDIYKHATAEPYSFLYCNCRDNSFRVNFDEEIIPEEIENNI